MANQGIYVGLDIGTTSIKVIVAEYVQGQMNVIGVGSQRSEGLSRGVIVDIDKAAASIRAAVKQAEEKASIQIDQVIAGVPANQLQIESVSGMIAVGDQSKEIVDKDVASVASAALVRNLPPEREVLSLQATEFIVDGFDGIKDPRGMIGVRLELHGILFTAPKTVLHNTKKAIEKAGLTLTELVVNPLATGLFALNDSEQDFGTVVIDLGGGQSTAAVIHDYKLKFADVDQEGGDFVTKDISVVLNTSFDDAEKLKRDYGNADSLAASEDETFPVTVVGKTEPAMISEQYLAEIIEARLTQIFSRLEKSLSAAKALSLPGGIVITGGTTALPGVVELAQDIFKQPVKRFVPSEMGIRHPSFTQALALVHYALRVSEVDRIVMQAVPTGIVPPKVTAERVETPQETPQKTKEAPAEKKPAGWRRFLGTFFE